MVSLWVLFPSCAVYAAGVSKTTLLFSLQDPKTLFARSSIQSPVIFRPSGLYIQKATHCFAVVVNSSDDAPRYVLWECGCAYRIPSEKVPAYRGVLSLQARLDVKSSYLRCCWPSLLSSIGCFWSYRFSASTLYGNVQHYHHGSKLQVIVRFGPDKVQQRGTLEGMFLRSNLEPPS